MNTTLSGKRFVITGGSGFLGISLARYLTARGAEVITISRTQPHVRLDWKHLLWDGVTVGPWHSALDGAAGLINLAGRSVACIKSADHQDEILRSRVESTRVLGNALRQTPNPPPVWVQMSTAHIYGDSLSTTCTEDSATGYGFAPFVGAAWEEAFRASLLPRQRPVILRTSFVLGVDRGAGGGALDLLIRLSKLGLGGTIGHGRQGVSWIHELDLNRLMERSLIDESIQGTYIAAAPNPVSQREFARELRMSLGVAVGLPASVWMVRLAAPLLLATDPDLAIYGRYVVSKRLADERFEFQFPTVREAFRDLVGAAA